MTQEFETVIGIEVHAQLKTNTKLFSTASNMFGDKPNTNVTEVCLGMPGALPVLNKQTVFFAAQAGFALDCEVRQTSVFSRKNYFYPDLPKGYQISQFDLPICEHGSLTITVNGEEKVIGITRIHMEEDAGKLIHQGADGIAGSTHSHVDLNRAGTPLIEIVSEPDIRSADEAKAYVEELRLILRHIGVCDGNMEEGSLRADANVSIRPMGETKLGTRTEIKNLNSFRSIERAILVEVARQKEVILSGGSVVQETRNFDDKTQTTTTLRSKEDAHDYRYFPEPDLPPLVIDAEELNRIKKTLPELPQVKRNRYLNDYSLSDFEVKVILGDIDMDTTYRACLNHDKTISPKECAKWIVGDINAALKEKEFTFESSPLSPEHIAELISLLEKETISGKMAKELLPVLIETKKSPSSLVKERGGGQISDQSELETIVKTILDKNPDVVEKIKNGKKQAAGFLVGQVMKETRGKAKPDVVNQLITKLTT
jgi:aspartyl-tRNA(Asn)/glutamyl-tRNA(Gln) amidotransferase subunit B